MYILKYELFAQHIVLPNKCNKVCKWCQEATPSKKKYYGISMLAEKEVLMKTIA